MDISNSARLPQENPHASSSTASAGASHREIYTNCCNCSTDVKVILVAVATITLITSVVIMPIMPALFTTAVVVSTFHAIAWMQTPVTRISRSAGLSSRRDTLTQLPASHPIHVRNTRSEERACVGAIAKTQPSYFTSPPSSIRATVGNASFGSSGAKPYWDRRF